MSVKLFTNTGYNGNPLELGIGNYDNNFLKNKGFISNNGTPKLSSFKILGNVKLILYSAGNYSGVNSTRTVSSSALGRTHKDNVRSLKVVSTENFTNTTEPNNNLMLLLLIIGLFFILRR